MKRAIVLYVEGKRDLLIQFACLYTSFRSIKSTDTDLIVFGPIETLQLLPNDCIKVEYDSLNHSYPFINSISCIANKQSSWLLYKYDYILRTDVDTFLTPAWNTFYPDSFTVGLGKYAHDSEVKNKLMNLARQFGLNHHGIHNIGTSHYGHPQQMINVCKLSLLISNYLLANDFKESEGKWPGWYKGVTTMYSNEVAINHLIEPLNIMPNKLDFDSTSESPTVNHPHIHCWHTDQPFSKFLFSSGAYSHTAAETLNKEIVRDYCMYNSLTALKEMKLVKNLL